MVKINLLPVKTSRKKENAKRQIAVFAASIVGVIIVGVVFYSFVVIQIKGTKEEIARSESELQQLKAKIGKIDNIKKLQDEVKKKLDVLSQLRRGKTGPVTRLATLAEAVPDKLWLTKYTENAENVSISGIALNEDLIAEFMRNLQFSTNFSGVELIVSEQTNLGELKAKRFDLNCVLKSQKAVEPSPAPKK